MRSVLFCGLLALSACQPPDWRAQAIAAAEAKVKAEVGDPAAQFLNVQFIGDQKTGQTCGAIQAASRPMERFIVYIDGTAGPYVEGADPEHLSSETFYAAWENDCLAEGYIR